MERKLTSTMSAIRPIIGGGVALGLWLVCSDLDRNASSSRLTWGTLAAPLPRAASSLHDALSNVEGSVAARVERSPDTAGGEQLRGQMHIDLPDSHRSLVVSEHAQVAPSGRLDRVEVSLVYASNDSDSAFDGDELVAETFDAVAGSVSILHSDGRREERPVPSVLPWVYLPIRLPSGALVSTPIAAAVARRAARAGNTVLRLAAFEPEVSVTVDQFDVPGDNKEWLLLGEDLATFAADEHGDLLTLHLAALGVVLRPNAAEYPGPTHFNDQREPWKICGNPRCDGRRIYPML